MDKANHLCVTYGTRKYDVLKIFLAEWLGKDILCGTELIEYGKLLVY